MICQTSVVIAALLSCAPGAVDAAASSAPATADGSFLRAERLYSGLERSSIITVVEEAGENLSLMLLESNGNVIVPGYPVEAGQSIDLHEEFPVIWRLRRTAYLQLTAGGEPVGSALVIQPLLNRPPIWTQKEYRPETRAPYTRIIGWGSEPPEGWRKPRTRMVDTDGDGVADTVEEIDDLDDRAPQMDEDAMSGVRIYPERDVVLHTTHGAIRIAFTPEEAPNTVWNFLHLAENGFYDDVIFHRVVPVDRMGRPFVIQGGDPSGTGSGGPGWWLPIEPSQLPHDFGVISMARADDPDSAGSQFFLCLSRDGTSRLDGQYCAFGFAVEGASTIRAIASVPLANPATGRPQEPPVIYRAEPVPAPPRRAGQWRWESRIQPTDDVEQAPVRVPR